MSLGRVGARTRARRVRPMVPAVVLAAVPAVVLAAVPAVVLAAVLLGAAPASAAPASAAPASAAPASAAPASALVPAADAPVPSAPAPATATLGPVGSAPPVQIPDLPATDVQVPEATGVPAPAEELVVTRVRGARPDGLLRDLLAAEVGGGLLVVAGIAGLVRSRRPRPATPADGLGADDVPAH